MSQDCLFCKIIAGDIPVDYIKENEHVVVFKDISPKAPIHYLIVPRKHIENLHDMRDADAFIASEMAKMGRDLAQELHDGIAFNLVSNNGADASQSVFHMHWHFLAGKNIWRGAL